MLRAADQDRSMSRKVQFEEGDISDDQGAPLPLTHSELPRPQGGASKTLKQF